MEVIIKLALLGIVPVIASVALRLIDKKTKFKQMKYWPKHIIIGVIFGIISIIGSEFGIVARSGAIINVRDAAPICAGLIFSAPAGIIAGIIGGIERFLSVYWGGGEFTRWACSISTIFVGLFAAGIRKLIFDNHHGRWYYGLVSGVFIESFHMLMVFVTHINEVEESFDVVKVCALPMIIVNSICITIAMILVAVVSEEGIIDRQKPRKLTTKLQVGLAFAVLAGFLVVSLFMNSLLKNISETSTESSLETSISDVKKGIVEVSNNNLLEVTRKIAYVINLMGGENCTSERLISLKDNYDVTEINIVDSNNTIVKSTTQGYEGWSMNNGEQSIVFDCLNHGETEYVQEYTNIAFDNSIQIKYCGVDIENGGYVQVGYDFERFSRDINDEIQKLAGNRHIGTTGYIFVLDDKGNVVNSLGTDKMSDDEYKSLVIDDLAKKEFNGEDYYYYIEAVEGYLLGACMSTSEADLSRNVSLLITTFLEVLVFFELYCVVFIMIKRMIVNRIKNVNQSLELIASGNLDEKIDERNVYELNLLSNDINATVDTLKDYIDQAEKKMDEELNFAKNIQHSAMPSTFPPYPNVYDFEIYATMNTAKEVGGDFYDFYLIDPRHLVILIADVSGKGVPAAMFMMQSKTIIKSLVETGLDVDNAFTLANSKICETNDAQMFVTAWMGVIDLDSGDVTYVNAGHNPPLIRRGGKYEYLTGKRGLVLAAMDGIRYIAQSFHLEPNDQIYLYTDGVTEANNINNELFGEERLINFLNNNNFGAEAVCEQVFNEVSKFSEGVPQADDITMLALDFFGKRNIKDFIIDAKIEEIPKLTEAIDIFLEENGCPMKANTQIDVAIDEIVSNIAFYAYDKEQKGKAKVSIEILDIDGKEAIIKFEDHGIYYNPLEKEDPDTTLSAEEREIGGLGIFIVKKSMDEMKYERINGRNVLTLRKKF